MLIMNINIHKKLLSLIIILHCNIKRPKNLVYVKHACKFADILGKSKTHEKMPAIDMQHA